MEDLFNKIYTTEFLFEVFTGLDEGAIKDYYALFISSMAYHKFIEIDRELGLYNFHAYRFCRMQR